MWGLYGRAWMKRSSFSSLSFLLIAISNISHLSSFYYISFIFRNNSLHDLHIFVFISLSFLFLLSWISFPPYPLSSKSMLSLLITLPLLISFHSFFFLFFTISLLSLSFFLTFAYSSFLSQSFSLLECCDFHTIFFSGDVHGFCFREYACSNVGLGEERNSERKE